MDHFREYSTFCASHQKLKNILGRGDNEQLQEFLEVRNPNFETSLTLEQLLIKPIVVRYSLDMFLIARSVASNLFPLLSYSFLQRISRYPLFIDTMMKYTGQESDERAHLKGSKLV